MSYNTRQFNYEVFVRLLTERAGNVANQFIFDRASRITIAEAEADINKYLKSPPVIAAIGADVSFHFRIWLQVNPLERRIKVNLSPLTPVGLDCCLATGIPVEDSLQKQIRKAYNESLREILSAPQGEAAEPERRVRDSAGEGRREQEAAMEEQDVANQDGRGIAVPVPDPGNTGM